MYFLASLTQTTNSIASFAFFLFSFPAASISIFQLSSIVALAQRIYTKPKSYMPTIFQFQDYEISLQVETAKTFCSLSRRLKLHGFNGELAGTKVFSVRLMRVSSFSAASLFSFSVKIFFNFSATSFLIERFKVFCSIQF